jgi:alkylated DNA repair dioxygenase AlkB
MNDTNRRRAGPSSSSPRADLFTAPNALPKGFCYRPNILSGGEEDGLAREVADLAFKPFDFHGYLANRQVVSFGYRYDYDRGAVVEASPFSSFLVSLRNKVAAIFDRPAEDFRQVLINEHRPGAGIGWHRDKAQFDEVVGVSLLAPCVLRFRRRAAETWDGVSLAVEPCSAYLLSEAARTVWEHSIPALERLRYSITLRTLVAKARSGEERT